MYIISKHRFYVLVLLYGRRYTVLRKLVFLLSPSSSTEMCAYKYLDLPQQTHSCLIFHRNKPKCVAHAVRSVERVCLTRNFSDWRICHIIIIVCSRRTILHSCVGCVVKSQWNNFLLKHCMLILYFLIEGNFLNYLPDTSHIWIWMARVISNC